MSNRENETIGRKKIKVTRISRWHSPTKRREIIPEQPEKFQHFFLMHYGAAIIRQKMRRGPGSVSDSLTLPSSHRGRHFWRNMWFESRNAKVCYHPPSIPRPYIDFRFSQIFSISLSCPCCSLYSSILSIYLTQLRKLGANSTKLRDTWLLFSVKINSGDSRSTLLPILLAYFRIIKSFSQSTTYFLDTTCYPDTSHAIWTF